MLYYFLVETVAIFNILRSVPQISEEQAHELAETIGGKTNLVTKSELESGLVALESRLESKTWRIVFTVVAIMNALLFAALKFTG